MTLTVGIVVARETVDHPWEEIQWRPVGVILDAPAKAAWREVSRGRGFINYHAANLPLTLSAKCVMNYRVNLANGVPSVYVVVRQRLGAGADVPIDISRVSVSPFEVDAQGLDASEHVERVPMPADLVAAVQSFIDDTATRAADSRPASRMLRDARDDVFGGFGINLGFSGHLSPGK